MGDNARKTAVLSASPLILMKAGYRALTTVPGLRQYLGGIFLFIWAVVAVLGVGLTALCYTSALVPALEWVTAWGETPPGWHELASRAGTALLWLSFLGVALVAQAGAVLASLSLLEEFFEGLVSRIVSYRRRTALPSQPLTLKGTLTGMVTLLKRLAGSVFRAVLMLCLVLIPIVGPVLAFVWNVWRVGQDIRAPYQDVVAGLGEDTTAWKSGLAVWTLQTGASVLVLACIPVLGVVLLPLGMVTLVSGVAWVAEDGGEVASA